MRYAYHDLGGENGGSTALVRWRGSGADVLLLDPVNFTKFCEGRAPVRYRAGGRYARPPARFTIPQDGRWYVVADLHGYSANAEATVELVSEDGTRRRDTEKEALVELR